VDALLALFLVSSVLCSAPTLAKDAPQLERKMQGLARICLSPFRPAILRVAVQRRASVAVSGLLLRIRLQRID
jgi:hypothetical protein